MSSHALLPPTTDADTVEFSVTSVPARLTATGLAGAETYVIQSLEGEDKIPADISDGAGSPLTLTATDPGIVLYGIGAYIATKDATADESGLFLAE